jgi:hypothetical protein
MAKEHYALIEALESDREPEFTMLVRKTLTGFAFRWISAVSHLSAKARDEALPPVACAAGQGFGVIRMGALFFPLRTYRLSLERAGRLKIFFQEGPCQGAIKLVPSFAPNFP